MKDFLINLGILFGVPVGILIVLLITYGIGARLIHGKK